MKLFLFVFMLFPLIPGHAQDKYVDALFNKKLALTREILTRPKAHDLLVEILGDDLAYDKDEIIRRGYDIPKGKDISETQLMMLMDQNPELIDDLEKYVKEVPREVEAETRAIAAAREKWKEKFIKVLSDEEVRARFRNQNNPFEPYEITEKQGYSNIKTYVNHPRIIDGKEIPADDLKKIWIEEIRKAKKEIAINVFDFDQEEVADELIKARKRGVAVKVGIDKSVVEAREEVQLVFDKLKKNDVFVHAVDSVGLNHQKMMSIDWSVEGKGKVVFSSGNLTQSCIGAEGDLKNIPKALRPKFSVPNANHVITMNSDVISSIVSHEISKTIDPGYQLRGKTFYPLGGVYKINGGYIEGKRSSVLLAFSPNGALRAPNKNFISQALTQTTGPVKMIQFAYSSETINEAMLMRAEKEIAKNGKFVFKSVGDTPFAMMDWSRFLNMSGLELIRVEDSEIPPKYVELEESKWKSTIGNKNFTEFKDGIKVAPDIYGNHYVDVKNEKMKVTSKIHHKVLITGEKGSRMSITGSYNFSSGAETNQEYLLMFDDERVTRELDGAIEYLHKESKASVYEEALARNISRNFEEAIPADNVKAMMLKLQPKKKCKELLNLINEVKGARLPAGATP